MKDYNAELRERLGTWTCTICGRENTAGLGWWAVHWDEDVTPVCKGKCWREYSRLKEEAKALGIWEMLLPGLSEGDT